MVTQERLIPPVAVTSYNCKKTILINFTSAQWWRWLKGQTVNCLTKAFNHPLKKPLLCLQEGQGKEINKRMRQLSLVDLGFCRVMFCLVVFFSPKAVYRGWSSYPSVPSMFFTTLNPDILPSFQMASLRSALCEGISFPSAEVISCDYHKSSDIPRYHTANGIMLRAVTTPLLTGSQLCLALAAAQRLIPEQQQLTTACMGHYTDVYTLFQKDPAKPYTLFCPWPRT